MMTDYTVTNVLDVFSTTNPGTINLYTTSGSFSTQLSVPSVVASSYNLSLPPTSGTTNQFCQLTGTNSLEWTTTVNTNVTFPYIGRTQQDSTNPSTTTSTTNVAVDYFYFRGTSTTNNTPSSCSIIIECTDTTSTCTFTILDLTNSTTILTSPQAALTNANAPTRRNTATLTNLSSGPALWQALIRRTSGTGTFSFYSMQVIGDYLLF